MHSSFFTYTSVALSLLSLTNAHLINHNHQNLKRGGGGLTVTDDLPSGWTYSGCYTDKVSSRTLTSDYKHSDDMTESQCITYCLGKGYNIAGVEYSRECFCGYELASTSTQAASESECNMPCAGDDSEACGGPDRINIFKSDKGPISANKSPTLGGWTYQGCYSDSVSSRSLSTFKPTSAAMTVDTCIETCRYNGFSYAGVEYGQECFCGNSISSPGKQIAESSCNMACQGNLGETCGGRDALNLYRFGSLKVGCGAPLCQTSMVSSSGQTYRRVRGECGLFVYGYQWIGTGIFSSTMSDCEVIAACAQYTASRGATSFTTYRPSWEDNWHCDAGFNREENLTFGIQSNIVYNSYLYIAS